MEPYAVHIHLDLLEMIPSRGEQRRLIMTFIRSFADNPRTPGDLTDTDKILRRRQIKIVGRYAVPWWVDDPVKAVMVVDVQPADR